MNERRVALPVNERQDISRFVIHLTRDDRKSFSEGGALPEDNFTQILSNHEILAFKAHCLHNTKIRTLSTSIKNKFRVCCFTEVPLTQIHNVIGEIPGRSIRLKPYGFVFRRKFIVENGGQPAIYINSYGGNASIRDSVDKLYEMAEANNFQGKTWKILPYVNAMHERYDFTWEREWRIAGNLKFKLNDLVCCILPDDDDDNDTVLILKREFAKSGIPVISPGWSYEQIIDELARQQRRTKRLTEAIFQKKAISKQESHE